MESLLKDIRYGYRTLLRNPGFAAVAVISLAFGIGANTAIFSFIDTVLLKTLPVREPGRLAIFGEGQGRGVFGGPPDGPMELFGWEQYRNFRKQNQVFDDVLAINSSPARLYLIASGENSTGIPEPAQADLVSGNYFDVLGVKPAAGRFFNATADDALGASPFVVLNDGFWERRFHRSPSVLGLPLRIGEQVYTVIGVAPRSFFGTRVGGTPDIWLPVAMQDRMPGSRTRGLLKEPLMQFMYLIGRLKPGVAIQQAQANVNVLYQQMLPGELGDENSPEGIAGIRRAKIQLTAGDKGLSGGLRRNYENPLQILMVVVALVLLIACANVANLLLALSSKRRKEFVLRVALGAARGRVIRQLLTESLLLSGAGGLLGILFASVGGKLLVHLISTGPRVLPLDFVVDQRVLAFTICLSVLTGLLFGLAPAWRASRVDLNTTLKEGKSSMASPSRVTFGRVLVAGQVALSLGLLVTAGLLLHSFSNLVSVETGFERQNVLLFKLDTQSSGYDRDQQLLSVYRQVEDSVSRLPGVNSEGVSLLSFNEGRRQSSFTAPGVSLPDRDRVSCENYVSPGFFSVLHIPIVMGRGLTPQDTAASPMVTVVSETFATKIFGNPANALGRSFTFDGEKKPVQIVGIARDVKSQSVRDKDLRMSYRSVYQIPDYMNTLAVRVTGDPAQVAAAVRRTLQTTARNIPIRWTTTLADEVGDSLVRERAIAQLSSFFAALALALSAIGLYGTISFAVARRTSEIGIRMALGAERVGVVRMVLRDAMLLAGIGMVVGLPLALLATRQMSSMLYGLGSIDVPSVVYSMLALSMVAAIAGYLPARRAANVDPMTALRHE
jgi:predicted permease